MKFTTREGSKAVYGNSFRIENVMIVTNLNDSTSKRKEQAAKQEETESRGFEGIFKRACAVERREHAAGNNQDISYTASGYTRNGMAYEYLEKRREYIH